MPPLPAPPPINPGSGVAPVPPPPSEPIPTFDLRVQDLSHPGVAKFNWAVPKLNDAMKGAVQASFRWLYAPETIPADVQTILLVLRSMDGVAYTTGHRHFKEIHFSLDYIAKCSEDRDLAAKEIQGVLVHEVVHCYQYNAHGQCPGGLIEGIADFVRLQAGYEAPHWKQKGGEKWDAGYSTTAYFLKWIETRYGTGTVIELNEAMKDRDYHRRIFKKLTGRPVRKLWKIYRRSLGENPDLPVPVPAPGPGPGDEEKLVDLGGGDEMQERLIVAKDL
ncbi:BSP-domain-containing protein [Pluteus cervinus]|uniref:BSP-domain-containing protein n=1 Tax=Pluteus cervinus TaxID=181527 RepID=A0ACD3AYM1_9AGAR|nr:BSP-domain-containing protein [Pluteus cervinus]